MSDRKRISLSHELHLLAHALDAAVLLADERHEGEIDLQIGSAVAAVLVLSRERLRLLDRVVRDVVDPRLLWCEENAAAPRSQDELPDVERDRTFVAWSDRKTAERHLAEHKKALRRIELERSTVEPTGNGSQ